MRLACAALVLSLAAPLAGAGPAFAAFPGADGALLVSGWTADAQGACFTARVPRVVALVADPDMECDFDDPPDEALFLAPARGGLQRLGEVIAQTRFSPSGGRIVQCGPGGLRVAGAWPGAPSHRIGPARNCNVTWSGGGSRIVFQTALRRSGAASDVIAWRPAAGGAAHVLRRGTTPAASSGGRIAYVRDDHIWLMGLDGRHPRRLLRRAAPQLMESAPDWSPDGRRLVFVRSDGRRGVSSLWVAGTDGAGLRRLTTWRSVMRAPLRPVWSPDGRWIAFEHGDSVWRMPSARRRPSGPIDWRRVILHAHLIDWQARR